MAEAPCAADRIIELLTRADPTWHPKTIKAFLNRLVKKRVLGFRKEGRAYLYARWCGRASAWRRRSQSFLERVFGGALKPMLVHFVQRQKLAPDEVRELKELLEQREPGSRAPSKRK